MIIFAIVERKNIRLMKYMLSVLEKFDAQRNKLFEQSTA